MLFRKKKCLKYEDNIKEYEFYFSQKCTLHDIPNTFLDNQVHGGILPEKPNSKNPLYYFEDTPKTTKDFQKTDKVDPASLREGSSSPNSALWN